MTDEQDSWTDGRRDAERGRSMLSHDAEYIDGWTSLRKMTETWDAYVERRQPIIDGRLVKR